MRFSDKWQATLLQANLLKRMHRRAWTYREFNHAANDSPRSGSSKNITPVVWAALVVAAAAVVLWFAIKP